MSYVENNLLVNEQVTYRARLHWTIYWLPVLLMILAVIVGILGGWLAGGVLAIVAVFAWLPPWIRSVSSEFAITNKRVLIKIGLVRRHSVELLLQKVEGIGVDQSILARILGYGTITVSGVGGTKESFRMIADPLEFRRQVQTNLGA